MFKSNQDLSVQETSCGSDGCGCGSSGQPLFARDDQSRKGAVGLINSSNLLHVLRIALSLALLAAGIAGSRMLPVYIQWAGFVLAYLLVGWTVVRTAVRNILRGKVFDEMFLMTIATLGAFAIGEPAEAVAVMLFYSVGEFFQDAAVDKSRRSIAALMNLRPEKARVLRESREPELIAPEEVMVGWIIEVLPGERIPLDGDVVSGESSLDTSALTGESIPRSAGPGDEVAAGYINESGRLHIQVTREFSQSSVSRILQLVQEASERKAPTERFISRFAGTYTRIVVGIAAVLAVLPPLLLADAAFSDWIYRALVVLVISCPCALVVSIPLGYFGGIGGASRRRVLVKGANYLDALNDLHTVVFDKTGTLTRGVFEVTRIEPRGGYSAGQLLQLAAQAESGSTHPIALSIRKAFDGEVDADAVTGLREEKGYGVFAVIGGRRVLAGSHRLMHRESIEHEDCDVIGTAVFVAVDDEYAGYLLVSDEVKPEAAAAIARLRRQGVKRIVMLTGDNSRIAEAIAAELGIDEIHSELLPEDKVAIVEQLQNELDDGRKLAFTGDGINDAPVLMRADIGISMGGLGSDAAIEASDIVIMNDKVDRVAAVLDTARRTHAIVRQNIVFTLGAKMIFIALGAVGFVGMWAAVIGDVGVALLAVANATRTLRISRAEAAEN